MTPQEIKDELVEVTDGQALLADGFDDALIGHVALWALTEGGGRSPTIVALYDLDAVIETCVGEGMGCDEAEEHVSFNVLGAYVGEHTPAFATVRRPAGGPARGESSPNPRDTTDGLDAPRCETPTSGA